MTITFQEEQKHVNGKHTVSMQYDTFRTLWEVAVWDEQDQCLWYKTYHSQPVAREAYNTMSQIDYSVSPNPPLDAFPAHG